MINTNINPRPRLLRIGDWTMLTLVNPYHQYSSRYWIWRQQTAQSRIFSQTSDPTACFDDVILRVFDARVPMCVAFPRVSTRQLDSGQKAMHRKAAAAAATRRPFNSSAESKIRKALFETVMHHINRFQTMHTPRKGRYCPSVLKQLKILYSYIEKLIVLWPLERAALRPLLGI